MADARWDRLRNLFDRARDMTTAERAALLDRELADEPGLRADLVALLDAGDAAHGFLAETEAPGAGSIIGPYRLLEILGQGGFGVVYLAEQERPIRRRVALKLIKPGMDTRQVIGRFEVERQALALMDHPGIAQVFDAGETESGRPYFAMEYVPGAPITVYCDREKLKLGERLEIFLAVCDAIQHAHQKGVIHRDIKPSNVLVSSRDGAPALKVIDFGIAKATEAAGMDGPTMTREGTIVGTAGYMSPEQLGAITAPIDTRSDIYSLGALLYELLTSDPPFDRDRLRGASWLDTLHMVLEDPTPPAVKAARSDTGEIARNRSTDSRSLIRALRGELEWITLKALEKEPDRRYSSASELAADVRRYLAHEPVMAAAPDTWYRVRKYARRHRVGVTAAAVVLVAIVAGGIAAAVGFGRAVKAEQVARREAASSRQVADFLVGLFHASSPGGAGDSMTVRQLLDEGTRRIEADTTADLHVRARLLGAISDSYLNLNQDEEGLRLTREALAAVEKARPRDEVAVAHYLDKLANAFSMSGMPDSMPPLVDRAIGILAQAKPGDPDLLSMLYYRKARNRMNLGALDEADSIIVLALATAEALPEPNPGRLTRIYGTRATLAAWRYRHEEAVEYSYQALKAAGASGELMRAASIHRSLTGSFVQLGKTDSALVHAQIGVELARRLYDPDHPKVAEALGGMTEALKSQERYQEAIQVQQEVIGILRKKSRPGEQLAFELMMLGDLFQEAGRPDSAIATARQAVDQYKHDLGPTHFRVAESLANLGRYQMYAGQRADAEPSFRESIAILDRSDDPTIIAPLARYDYGNLCLDMGRPAQADTLFARAVAALDSTEGTRPYFALVVIGQARVRVRQGKVAEAESLMATAFRMTRGNLAEDHADLADAWLAWAELRLLAGDGDSAVDMLRKAERSGASEKEAGGYPELAALRSRPDYPLDNSP